MMPPEGPNKSEELLQRYAKERREQGGDFSLHPATRQLLQGEVARQFKGAAAEKSKPASWWTWFTTWPGRFAVGTACVAAGLAAWVYWNGTHSGSRMEMAQSAKQDVDVFYDGAKRAESTPSDALLAERETAGPESKKMLGDEQSLRLNEARKQQRDAKDTFGSVEFYAKNATNAFSYGVSLDAKGESDSPSAATGAMTNISIASLSARDSAVLNTPAPGSEAAATDPTTRLPQTDSRKSLALLDRMEVARPTDRSDAEKPTAARPDTLTRSRSGDLTGAPAAPAQAPSVPPLNAPAPAPVATPPPPSVVAGAAIVTAPEEPLTRRMDVASADTTRFYRLAPTGPATTAGREVAAQSALAKERQGAAGNFRVLARFVVEQQTNSVRLLDADGSIYEGTLTATSSEKLNEFSEARDKDQFGVHKAEALADGPSVAGLGYAFRASGSNVTLRQIVEVSGRLTPATNVSTLGIRGFGGAPAAPAPVARRFAVPVETQGGLAPASAPPDSEIIDGTVRIGTGATERFRALRETTPR